MGFLPLCKMFLEINGFSAVKKEMFYSICVRQKKQALEFLFLGCGAMCILYNKLLVELKFVLSIICLISLSTFLTSENIPA